MDFKVLIYWFVVGVPLSWGLYKSVERSVPLFAAKPAAATASPGSAAATTAPASSPAPPR